MAHRLFCLGSIPQLVRCEIDKIWSRTKIRRGSKSNFVDLRRTKKSIRLPDKNKEQCELYKQLVHDYKPIPFVTSSEPQKDVPQLLNKKVKKTRDLGTQSGNIHQKAKKTVSFQENTNMKTFAKKYSQSDVTHLIALANLVHNNKGFETYNEKSQSEGRYASKNKNLLINTTVDVLKPDNLSSGMKESYEVTINPNIKSEIVQTSKCSPSDCSEKEFSLYEDASQKKQLLYDALEKHYKNNLLVNTLVSNCHKKGFSLYKDLEENLHRKKSEEPLNESLLVNTLVVGGLKLEGKMTEIADEDINLKDKLCHKELEEPLNEEVLVNTLAMGGLQLEDKMTGMADNYENTVKMCEHSSSDSEKELLGFSLYEDACQIESLPPDALENQQNENLCFRKSDSLNALVHNVRQRNRSKYFESCVKSLGVGMANRPTCFPPLGPPPVMFPASSPVPPLPSCPKKGGKKKNKK